MPFGIDDAAMMALGPILGLATASWQDQRQLDQQKELQALQLQGAKEMGRFNQALALDTWEKTNYPAQVQQMQKAGLNVGLMYKGAGAGGTTMGGSSQMPSSSSAPSGGGEIGMGIQTAMQLRLLQAQTENIQADTKVKETEAAFKAGPGTAVAEAQVGLMVAQKLGKELENVGQAFQNVITQVQANVATLTQEAATQQIVSAAKAAAEGAKAAVLNNTITEATLPDKIRTIQLAAMQAQLQVEATKAGIIKTGQETLNIQKDRELITEKILSTLTERNIDILNADVEQRRTYAQEVMTYLKGQETAFNTDTPAYINQWIKIIGDLGDTAARIAVAGKMK